MSEAADIEDRVAGYLNDGFLAGEHPLAQQRRQSRVAEDSAAGLDEAGVAVRWSSSRCSRLTGSPSKATLAGTWAHACVCRRSGESACNVCMFASQCTGDDLPGAALAFKG